jgi:GntR family transcriptional regulator/MocR family aminotransferase
VSRSTVVQAFDQLRAEGYIESLGRGSTRVSVQSPEGLTRAEAPAEVQAAGRAPGRPSKLAMKLGQVWPHYTAVSDMPPRAFRTSVPALDVFPMDVWGRLMARIWRRSPAASLGYADARGLPELRQAIADYLTSARGVRCTAEQVIVTSGSQHALDLVGRVLLDPGDTVWVEDPGYFGASGALLAAGARLEPIPVDREGLDVAEGVRRAPRAKLAFVTPARQLPLGITMSLARRLALLAWAAARGSWVLEDDYDSEFRYTSRPLSSMQGLAAGSSVIFTGTFSKVMFPALRLGYLVVPEGLVGSFATVRRYMDFCPPSLTQAVMAEFIREGHFDRHIRRMRTIYQSRRNLLVKLLTRELGGLLEIDAPDSGMNLMAWLPRRMNDAKVSARLLEEGIDAIPLSAFVLKQRRRPGLLLGFSGIREPDIRVGVSRLRRVLEGGFEAEG